MDELRQVGGQLVAISPQLPDHSREMISKYNLQFEILYDPENQYAQQLDLVHGFDDALKQVYIDLGIQLDEWNGRGGWHLPIPTRMVVDGHHMITSIDVNPDYTQRPEPAATLMEVKQLVASTGRAGHS